MSGRTRRAVFEKRQFGMSCSPISRFRPCNASGQWRQNDCTERTSVKPLPEDRCVVKRREDGDPGTDHGGSSRGRLGLRPDDLEVSRLAIARSVEVVEHRSKLVAAALIKPACRLIVGAMRGLNIDARPAGRHDLSLVLCEE